MERRTFWKALAGIPVLLGLERHAAAAPAESMKAVDELQKGWKALLADGTKVPLPSDPLKLSKDEWKKRLAGLLYEHPSLQRAKPLMMTTPAALVRQLPTEFSPC